MVHREHLFDPWHCSWGSFTHEDLNVVVDHENNEYGGKKE